MRSTGTRHIVIALALIAVALVVRTLAIRCGHQLDIDEADTAMKIGQPVGALLADLRRDGHPPLYFLLLKLWAMALGRTEPALRALSTAISLGELALLLAVGRRLFGGVAAAYAGLLFALSPVETFHAIEGRMYTLVPFEALAAFALAARLLDSERSGAGGAPGAAAAAAATTANRARDAALLFVVLVAALYTHNYGLFVPLAVAGAAAAVAARRARREGIAAAGRAIAAPVIAAVLAYAAYIPWLPVLQAQRASRAHEWLVGFFDATPPILAIPLSLAALSGIGPYPPITPPLVGLDIFRPLALPLGIVLLAAGAASAFGARRPDSRAALPVFGLALLLAPWLVSVTSKVVYLVGRYDVVALPFALLVLGAGAAALIARSRALAIVPLLFLAAPLPGLRALVTQRRGGDAVEMAAVIAVRPDTRAVIATQLAGSRLRYYLARAGRDDVLVRSFPTSTDLHPGWLEESDAADPSLAASADSLVGSLHDAFRLGDILWTTLYDDDATKPVLVHALARRFAADGKASRLDIGLLAVRKE